ncbi:hypothetical protein [Sphingomonas sp.]|uniref:hypothetical protein n=1 Tax=Sphingomonas sp. TaxID=28214 RepID=UPI003F70E1B4
MRIEVSKPFDHRFASGAVMHVTPWPEPITVKREVGETGVSKGCAVEVKGKANKGAAVEPDSEPAPGAVTMGDQTPPVIVSE